MPLNRELNFKVKFIKGQRPIKLFQVQSRVVRKVILAFSTNLHSNTTKWTDVRFAGFGFFLTLFLILRQPRKIHGTAGFF